MDFRQSRHKDLTVNTIGWRLHINGLWTHKSISIIARNRINLINVISPALSVESFSGLTLRSLESKCIDRNLYNASCNVNRTVQATAWRRFLCLYSWERIRDGHNSIFQYRGLYKHVGRSRVEYAHTIWDTWERCIWNSKQFGIWHYRRNRLQPEPRPQVHTLWYCHIFYHTLCPHWMALPIELDFAY